MKNTTKGAAALLFCAALLLSGCTASQEPASSGSQTQTQAQTAAEPSVSDTAQPRTPAAPELSGAAAIILSGGSASVEGSGASVEGGVVTITAGGVYTVSGTLEEGRILVNAPGAEVTLVLSGADIRCSYGSPLYIYKAETATVHLLEGTENALTDGGSYSFADSFSSGAEEEPNACLYSKADLVIQGAGSLTVTASYKNGVTGKDSLSIYDGTLSVTAPGNGVTGKDSCTIDSAALTVVCGGDALRSTNDSDTALGWVRVSDSVLHLTAGEDGIQGETGVTVSASSCVLLTGGGSGAALSGDSSAKGIKAGTDLSLLSGVYTLDCADDALHANGDVSISGGVYTISSGDDAVHADGTLTVSGGSMEVLTSYEGLEGSDVTVTGGTISLVSTDDGVNAAGGVDGSGSGGRGMGNFFAPTGGSHAITITGGSLTVAAGGDGLDSNGSLAITGGTVLVSSTGQGDGALDCDGTMTLSGGTVLAYGSGNMPQAPTAPEQYTLSLNFGAPLEAGTCLCLAGEGSEFVFRLDIPTANLVFSSPELVAGGSYTLSTGGDYTGGSGDILCYGGEYSGGTLLAELTLTNSLTSYGQAAMGGGQAGGRGGAPNGGPGSHRG